MQAINEKHVWAVRNIRQIWCVFFNFVVDLQKWHVGVYHQE